MTSVRTSEFIYGIREGNKDFTPQEVYNHINSDVLDNALRSEQRARTGPRYQAIQKSAIEKIDELVEKYSLKIDQQLNSQTSEAGKEISGIADNLEGQLTSIIIEGSWGGRF